jgi:hypothetical protein
LFGDVWMCVCVCVCVCGCVYMWMGHAWDGSRCLRSRPYPSQSNQNGRSSRSATRKMSAVCHILKWYISPASVVWWWWIDR